MTETYTFDQTQELEEKYNPIFESLALEISAETGVEAESIVKVLKVLNPSRFGRMVDYELDKRYALAHDLSMGMGRSDLAGAYICNHPLHERVMDALEQADLL